MKYRLTIAVLSVLIVVAAGAAVSKSRWTKGLAGIEPRVQAGGGSIPDYVLYDQLFRMVLSIKKKAGDQETRGEAVTPLKYYFKSKAGLTDEQNGLLEQAALDYLADVGPVDKQARTLIVQIRDQFEDGKIGAGQQVPAPPAELSQLQEQRNGLAATHRDKLQGLLGKDAFTQFDEFVQGDFSLNFQRIEPKQ